MGESFFAPSAPRARTDAHKSARGRKHVKVRSRKTVAVGLAAAVAAVVAVSSATGAKRAGILACGLMPDTKTSVRWEQFDAPYLKKAIKAAGISARVVNAQGDPQTQQTQAD